jgi:hypothetical protein
MSFSRRSSYPFDRLLEQLPRRRNGGTLAHGNCIGTRLKPILRPTQQAFEHTLKFGNALKLLVFTLRSDGIGRVLQSGAERFLSVHHRSLK